MSFWWEAKPECHTQKNSFWCRVENQESEPLYDAGSANEILDNALPHAKGLQDLSQAPLQLSPIQNFMHLELSTMYNDCFCIPRIYASYGDTKSFSNVLNSFHSYW